MIKMESDDYNLDELSSELRKCYYCEYKKTCNVSVDDNSLCNTFIFDKLKFLKENN